MIQGHTGSLRAVAFSADGGWLATTARDRTIMLWDIKQWHRGDLGPPWRFLGHAGFAHRLVPKVDGWIRCLAFQGTGRSLAACFSQEKAKTGLVRVWDLATDKQIFQLRGDIHKAAFSPIGEHLALNGPERTVSIWHVGTSKPAPALKDATGLSQDLAYYPDGSRLASAQDDGTIKVWDTVTGELLHKLRGHQRGKLAVAYCPKGRFLASAGKDSFLILRDPATGKEIRKLKHPGPLHSLTFSPDGMRLAVACGDSSVHIWEASTWQRTLRLRVPQRLDYQILFSPDGHRLAALVAGDAALRIWDASPVP
jgi:WD40 repeat protein